MLKTFFKNLLFIFFSILILLVVSEYKIKQLLKSEQEIPIPNLIGLDVLDAFEKIEKINKNLKKSIKIEIIPILNNHPLKYIVVKQYPYPQNLTIKEGQKIQLMVSKGNLNPKVPNYVGLPIQQVKKMLLKNLEQYYVEEKIQNQIMSIISEKKSSYHQITSIKNLIEKWNIDIKKYYLNLGFIHFEYHPTFDKGIIIQQSIKENQPIYKDLKINFIVSKGQKNTVQIDNYVGKPIEKIYPFLRNEKIFIHLKTVPNPDPKIYRDGDIVHQSIPQQEEIPYYNEIEFDIAISKSKSLYSSYRCIDFEIPNQFDRDKEYLIKIVLQNKTEEKFLTEEIKKNYEPIFKCMEVDFDSKILIYINNHLFKKYDP